LVLLPGALWNGQPPTGQAGANRHRPLWFYYRARCGTANRQLAKPGQIVIGLGDALAAGKSKDAIASPFEAAVLA
jgi:hypothetical protein